MGDILERLKGSEPLCAVNPGGPALPVVDALGRQDGAAVFIDCERTATGVFEASMMARAARSCGIFSLLRTESADPAIMTRYLDCGIDALVVPQVESGAQCAELTRVMDIHATTAPRTALIAQIESVAGHEALDAICAAKGVGAILIGPNDLAASMGVPGAPRHPRVLAAVEDIAARVRAAGLPFGLPVDASGAQAWAERGARLFYVPLAQLLGAGLGQIREALR